MDGRVQGMPVAVIACTPEDLPAGGAEVPRGDAPCPPPVAAGVSMRTAKTAATSSNRENSTGRMDAPRLVRWVLLIWFARLLCVMASSYPSAPSVWFSFCVRFINFS